MEFLFRKLLVWQKAMEFADAVYSVVKKLPPEERFALADQLRRAAISIPSNIAEGNGRAGNKDYAHFLAIARGSLYEVITQLDLAKRQGYISDTESLEVLADEISRMLTSMLKKYGALTSVKIGEESRSRKNDIVRCPPPPHLSSLTSTSTSSLISN